jgi:hypothetical protein
MPMTNTIRMPTDERRRLEVMLLERGQKAVAEQLGVNPMTLVRAIAGVGIQRTTAAALRAQLLQQPAATP